MYKLNDKEEQLVKAMLDAVLMDANRRQRFGSIMLSHMEALRSRMTMKPYAQELGYDFRRLSPEQRDRIGICMEAEHAYEY